MNDAQTLELLAATDAFPSQTPLPVAAWTRDAVLAEVERRTDMQTQQKTPRQTPPRRKWQGWLAAAAAFAIVIVIGGAMLLWPSTATDPVIEPTTTVPQIATTTPPLPETAVPPMVESWQRVGADVMNPAAGLLDMTRADSGFLAVGIDPGEQDFRQNGAIFASDDGVVWTRLAEDDPALNTGAVLLYGVTEGGPGLVAVGMGCEDDINRCSPYATAWTSTDGTAWTRTSYDAEVFADTTTQGSAMLDVVTTTAGNLVAVGSLAYWTLDEAGVEQSVTIHPATWTSRDGVTWERSWEGTGVELAPTVFTEVDTSLMHAVSVGPNGHLVAVGSTVDQDGESVAAVWISSDGDAWERIDPTSPAFGPQTVMSDVASGTGGFVAVGGEDGTQGAIWQSPDGRFWTRVDTSYQPFENAGTLGSVAVLDSGFVAVGPHPFLDALGGWVTLWTSPDGTAWDRVHAIGPGYATQVLVTSTGIAVAGGMAGTDDYHAAVWVGPAFDPNAPPSEPPPAPISESGNDGEGEAVDPASVENGAVGEGDPVTPPGDDYVAVDTTPRLPLGERTELPDNPRWDFHAVSCQDTCFSNPSVIDPDDENRGTGVWEAHAPFHIRQGFINETGTPLGDEFDVVVFVTRLVGPDLGEGVFEIGQTYRFDSDYVLQGDTTKCGPGYWEQTESRTCEWFVHDFADGLPPGRYDLWTGWYAPCSAWHDLEFVDGCDDSSEVSWQFSSSVNSPLLSDEYHDMYSPPFDPATLFAQAGQITRGWTED